MPRKRKRVGVTALRKKYPHPCRGIGSRDEDYCVGGSLCIEMGMGVRFPRWEQIRDAVEAATGLNHYVLSDDDNGTLRGRCMDVIRLNDSGLFGEAWNALKWLLHWNPVDRFSEPVEQRRTA